VSPRIGRRQFVTLLGGSAAAWPLGARAQQSSLTLVGVLNASTALTFAKELDTLRGALRDLGYVEGRNVRFEYRFADGDIDRLSGLAADLVGLNPNVIVSFPLPTTLALAKATTTIPIVMASGADPVGFGLAKSLSHPGGNVTGLTNFADLGHVEGRTFVLEYRRPQDGRPGTAGACRGTDPTASCRDRRQRTPSHSGGQRCNQNNPHRHGACGRCRRSWLRHKLC
jgi:ABC transporter substrate binding protein